MDELEKLKEEVLYWKDQYHLQKNRAEYVIRSTETPAEERYNIALQATILAAKQRQESLVEVLELREELERLKVQLGHRDKWIKEEKGWNGIAYELDKSDRKRIGKLNLAIPPKTFSLVELCCDEIERLKSGKFTEEEFQNLCHTFHTDDIRRFMFGCLDYQCKLFEIDKVKKELSRQLLNAIRGVAWPLNIQSYADALAEGLIHIYESEKDKENTNPTP